MSLTFADWLAIATVAVPLIAKALSDWSTNAQVKHNAALSRITGMAARQAATIARSLASLPPGTDPAGAERVLIADAASALVGEMGQSGAMIDADQTKLAGIVQGELNKLIVAPVPIPAAPLAPPLTPLNLRTSIR